MYTHILSAIDDSECASNALARAIDVARRQGARLTIVHVVDPVKGITVAGSPGVALIERLSDEGRALARAQARAAASGVSASTELQTGPTVEQIISTSRRLGCDLIVLGSLGRSGLSRVLFGSVAEGVMRDASTRAHRSRPQRWRDGVFIPDGALRVLAMGEAGVYVVLDRDK